MFQVRFTSNRTIDQRPDLVLFAGQAAGFGRDKRRVGREKESRHAE
jgi:hypothetical protein